MHNNYTIIIHITPHHVLFRNHVSYYTTTRVSPHPIKSHKHLCTRGSLQLTANTGKIHTMRERYLPNDTPAYCLRKATLMSLWYTARKPQGATAATENFPYSPTAFALKLSICCRRRKPQVPWLTYAKLEMKVPDTELVHDLSTSEAEKLLCLLYTLF